MALNFFYSLSLTINIKLILYHVNWYTKIEYERKLIKYCLEDIIKMWYLYLTSNYWILQLRSNELSSVSRKNETSYQIKQKGNENTIL